MSHSVLIAVTHLLGVGHLTRAAALGRGLAAAGHRVTLVTGGRVAPLVRLDSMTVVQLPPVHCRGVDFQTLLGDDGLPISDEVRVARIAALVEAVACARPDVVVTETFPFGRRQLAGEFIALIDAAERLPSRPAILASIRDILNPPSSEAKAVEAQERLGRYYDGVLVHGDQAVTALGASWPVDPALARRLNYTGYVVEAGSTAAGDEPAGSDILVSGGGSAASLPLYRAAVAAARNWPGPERWRLFIGHGVPHADFDELARQNDDRLLVERARPDFTRLLAGAALSVSQAGYNTMIDIAVARVRSVIVPFEQGREQEQRLRAECFAGQGLAEVVSEDDLTPQTLSAAVSRAMARPRPDRCPLDLNGIAGGVRVIEAQASQAAALGEASAALSRALSRARDADITIDCWWRDDDAVEPGQDLDRLLDLGRHHGIPIALAVIPQGATAALARRLAGTNTDVLVHGLAHQNHAPRGVKKQELGFRPAGEAADALRTALEQMRGLFGPRLLPVLVPPWNRIDAALLPLLPAAGFSGLSTYGMRPAASPAPGLVQVNTHVDPVDWKGGGGLVHPAALLASLAERIDAIVDGRHRAEPIGLLTHHLVHDPWLWHWIDRFVARLCASPAIRFISAEQAFKADCPPGAVSL